MAYTDEYILDRLKTHCVDEFGSVWTMSKPTWQGIQKRMLKDEAFGEEVRDIVAEALFEWEKMGIKALRENDENFNVQLFKHYTMNKKPFLDNTTIDLEERLEKLEQSTK